jgi:cyclic pyranopterin phosphate synthase
MVDVGAKAVTERTATASCRVIFPAAVMAELQANGLTSKKGPVVDTAVIAGIMAAKKTSHLIPMCHPLALTHCHVGIEPDTVDSNALRVECTVRTHGKTGVEMEALVGASNAGLCVYDMCKALSHDIVISDIRLESKRGGKSDYGN